MFGGRKRRGGEEQTGEAVEAVSDEARTQPQVAAVSGESDDNLIQAGGGKKSRRKRSRKCNSKSKKSSRKSSRKRRAGFMID
jgi:hypothetical protein